MVANHFKKNMQQININNLFRPEILNFSVDTKKLGLVNYVNLDNAATTPPLIAVETAVTNYMTSYGSVHRGAGTKSKISTDDYENSREVIKNFVHARPDDYVIFTGNTTGAMNTLAYFFSFLPGKVAVSAIEHSSSWLPWIKAEGIKMLGSQRTSLEDMDKVNESIQELGGGQVLRYDVSEKFEFNLDRIEQLLKIKSNHVKVLVATASSNVTGYCPDLKAIGKIAHRHGAYFIVDACQFIQHHPLDMQALGIDFLVASGHKFYAPFGGGLLIAPKKFCDKFLPYQIGGGNLPYITEGGEFLRYQNQLAHDPGTPNAVGAVAIAAALKELKVLGMKNVETYETNLTKKAYATLKKNPNVILHVNEKQLNTVIPFSIKGQDATMVAEKLNSDFGIGVRAGSFCVYNVVRKLMHVKNESTIVAAVKNGDTSKVPSIIRASFGLANRPEDVERFIKAITALTK